jgi:hypothetical protein
MPGFAGDGSSPARNCAHNRHTESQGGQALSEFRKGGIDRLLMAADPGQSGVRWRETRLLFFKSAGKNLELSQLRQFALNFEFLNVPSAGRFALDTTATSASTIMQCGSLIRKERKRGPDVWLFRWSEKDDLGRRIYRKRVAGTVDQYADAEAARNSMANVLARVAYIPPHLLDAFAKRRSRIQGHAGIAPPLVLAVNARCLHAGNHACQICSSGSRDVAGDERMIDNTASREGENLPG